MGTILALFGSLVAAFGTIAAVAERACAGGAGLDRRRVLSLHPDHLESVPALRHAADQGRDLNPVLQDIGLAVHPPILYLGYVGFSISFRSRSPR